MSDAGRVDDIKTPATTDEQVVATAVADAGRAGTGIASVPGALADHPAAEAGRGVHAAAIASLPQAGSRRLLRLLDGADPEDAWQRVCRGSVPDSVADAKLRATWRAHAAGVDLAAVAGQLDTLDAWVTTVADPAYPRRLAHDFDPAPVLFRRGRILGHDTPSVAIVGTRRCTPTGRSVAVELGAGLASAGVMVVSGLALGIDGAAHRGALSAGGAVAAVVGSGIDVVYPRGNSDLWQAVAEAGTLLSEAPLGAEPQGWRFPARNRLLAALADVVVVVESKRAGGSMHTVEEALKRDVTVMAVPGSVRNPAAAGTNFLLSEGCAPACSTEDVLVALGLATEGLAAARAGGDTPHGSLAGEERHTAASVDPLQRRVLDALDDAPMSIDLLVMRAGLPAVQVLAAAEQLEGQGLLVREEGRVMRA